MKAQLVEKLILLGGFHSEYDSAMNTSETFRRSQVEWALWRQYNAERAQLVAKPPAVFRSRVKRLLDLDREIMVSEVPAPGHAFKDHDAPGRGTDVRFAPFDSFCLAVAFDMLDAGLKIGEVVFFLQHVRPRLLAHYKAIMARDLRPDRASSPSKAFPDLPSYEGDGGHGLADWRVFLILRRIEPFAVARSDLPADRGIFLEPSFAEGSAGLCAYLDENPWALRKMYVGELAKPAVLTAGFLEQAPETHRGRA